jgi:hypothetical protein
MQKEFGSLIRTKEILTYLDDILAMADTKEELFKILPKLHDILRKTQLRAAPEKTFFFMRKVRYLGHMISELGLSPI